MLFRSAIEINADEIGPSLRYATAQVERNPRDGGDFGGNRGGGGGNRGGGNRPPEPVDGDEEPF